MKGDSKGSFFDRIRIRFRKIKLLFQKKKKKEYEEELLKEKKLKQKRKKEEEIIINNKTVTIDSYGMIISDGTRFKKHYGIESVKLALIPTTIFLTAFKHDKNTDVKIEEKIDKEQKNIEKDNQKKIIIENKPTQNAHNTYKSTHNVILNKQINDLNLKEKKEKNNDTDNEKKITINVNKSKLKEILYKNKNVNSKKISSFKKGVEQPKNLENANFFVVEPIITPKKENIKSKKLFKKRNSKKGIIINVYNEEKLKEKKALTHINLKQIEKINNLLEDKLKEQEYIYKEFNKKVKNIQPEKIISVKYHFINNLFSNFKNIFLSAMSIPLLKRTRNLPLFATGLFILNNSIRNMRKLVSTEETINYIPSNNYIGAIKSNLNNLELVEYMIEDSLDQIRFLRNDYVNKFSQYSYDEVYQKNLKKLDDYEKKMKEKQEKLEKEKTKMQKNIKENEKILRLIKDMNK